MAGLSVRFDSRMEDGVEVITLYYRVNGRLSACKCFTGSYDSCSGGSCSALLDMLRFVFDLGVKDV